jgi:3-oxoacyl-[acyl-carrier protein] reductase
MRFENQVVIVTGAGSGIGRAVALAFAREGAHVAVVDVDVSGAAETAAGIEAVARRSLIELTDVANSSQVRTCITKVAETFGRVDVLINSAGINRACRVEEVSDAEWDRIVRTNLDGLWFFSRYTIPKFIEQGKGVIVNIASIGAFQASHDRAPYMASKGGVVSLTKALALDFADRNIRVNAVAPGVIETAMGKKWRASEANRRSVTFLTPMGRIGQPEEVAKAVLFLASDDSSYITGEILNVDGGLLAGNRFGREAIWSGMK